MLGVVAIAIALTNAGPIALFLFPGQVVDPVTVEERQLYTGLGADELAATPAGWSQSFEYQEDPPTLNQLASVDSTILDGGDCEDYAAAVLAYLWGQGESASIVYYVSLDTYDAHMAVVDEDGLHYSSGTIGDYPPRAYADVNGFELVLKRKAPPPA